MVETLGQCPICRALESPIDRILVTFTDHVLVGIVKDDLDGILTVTAADPGVSIFLADHHGDAVEFTMWS